jgi:hypothetical protein
MQIGLAYSASCRLMSVAAAVDLGVGGYHPWGIDNTGVYIGRVYTLKLAIK